MTDLTQVINKFITIGLRIIPFLGSLAFLVFAWGVARFIRAAGNEKEVKESKNLLIWGIVGMLVLTSVWGIITVLRGEFGFTTTLGVPQIKFPQGI